MRVPADSRADLPQIGSTAPGASGRRFAPPQIGGPPSGPPAASLDGPAMDPFGPLGDSDAPPFDDTSRHNEFDLGNIDEPLQLDGLAPPARPAPPPVPSRPGPGRAFGGGPPGVGGGPPGVGSGPPGLRLDPNSVAARPSEFGVAPAGDDLDLPAPVDLDLPMPAPRVAGPRFAPAPSAGASGLDLPVPVDLDLPTPARARGGSDADLLAPLELDLPAPATGRTDLLTPVAGNEVRPAQSNLLTPVGTNLPTPVGTNLPTPVGTNLPTPVGTNLLTPVNLDLTPKAGDELAPHNLPMPKRGDELQPVGAAGAAAFAGAPGMPGVAPGHAAAARVPPGVHASPVIAQPPAVSRGLLIAVGGIALLGIVGAGVLYSGILDPEDPEVTARGGTPADGGSKGTPTPPEALTAPGDAVLAKLAEDRPAAYRAAIEAAASAGDFVGETEATVLLFYRYGPDPALAARAKELITPIAERTEPFVQRVVGLATLAAGDTAGAEPHLTGDDPRTRLYRGWLRLAQDKPDEALAEAEKILEVAPKDLGALHLELSARAATDPGEALEKLQAAVEGNAGHPALTELATTTALELGRLRDARKLATGLDAGEAPAAYVARLQSLQGRIAAAGGDYGGAIAKYEAALAAAPGDFAAREGKVRAMLRAGKLAEAANEAAALAREASTVEAQLLEAEVAIEGGDGDRALEILGKLGTKLGSDPRLPYLTGQVHAARLALEEARPLFAKAVELDPGFYEASIADARLLGDARQTGEAIGVFDSARKRAADAGRPHAAAAILVAKSDMLAKAGQQRAAIEALTQALDAEPENNDAQMRRGKLLLAAGERAGGKSDLVAVFERTGGYPGLAGRLGRLYVEDGELEQLEELVGDQLRGESTSDDLLLVGARLRLAQSRTDDARELVGFALVRNPADWEAHMLMAQVHLAEGSAEDALAEIERAAPSEPQPELLLQRGKILEFNGRHGESRPLYVEALKLDPGLHEARYLNARLLVHEGANGDAADELELVADAESAKSAPWYPEVFLYLGKAQRGLGKLDEATRSFKKATTLNADLAEAWAEAGRLAFARNQHGDAIKSLGKAVELGESNPPPWYFNALADLARSQHKSGARSSAKATIKKFLADAPADHTARDELQRLSGG